MKYRVSDMFDEYSVYDILEVIDSFDDVIGYSYDDIYLKYEKFNKNVINIDLVVKYCHDVLNIYNGKRLDDSIYDYRYFYDVLSIYANKAISILNLIGYLNSLRYGECINKRYEDILSSLNISHRGSVICGRDVIKIFRAIKEIIFKYDAMLEKINNLSTYNMVNVDDFAKLSGDYIYPSRSIVGDGSDITSINIMYKKKSKYI